MLIINNGHSAAACHAPLGVNTLSIRASRTSDLEMVWTQAGRSAAFKPTRRQIKAVLSLLFRICHGLCVCSLSKRIHLWHSFFFFIYWCVPALHYPQISCQSNSVGSTNSLVFLLTNFGFFVAGTHFFCFLSALVGNTGIQHEILIN